MHDDHNYDRICGTIRKEVEMDQRARKRADYPGNYLLRHVLLPTSAQPSCPGMGWVRILRHACYSHSIFSWTNVIFVFEASHKAIEAEPLYC
jgi:hypothetical protein